MLTAFNVSLNRKLIDRILYVVHKDSTIKETAEEIRLSLINHDGYDSGIKVTKERHKRAK